MEALALDPEFVMARLRVIPLQKLSEAERRKAREEVAKADRSGLTDRDRFVPFGRPVATARAQQRRRAASRARIVSSARPGRGALKRWSFSRRGIRCTW